MTYKTIDNNKYYQTICQLNIKHYTGEVPYYSYAPFRKVEEALLKRLQPGLNILDVGCGSGRFSINCAKRGFNVIGIDIAPDALKAAQKRSQEEKLDTITFLLSDMTHMPFQDNKFDYVICPRFSINAVATFPMRKQAIKEMVRVVKPGGKVFIESFNRFYMGHGPGRFIKDTLIDIGRYFNIAIAKISGQRYKGLLPGDVVYPSNKVASASEGYAHVPTIFEIRALIPPKVLYKLLSIPQIVKKVKWDAFKYLRYSIWIELLKR